MDAATAKTMPVYQLFIDRLKEASDGQIDVTLYSGGEIVPSTEIVHALDAGTIELAVTAGSYYVGEVEADNKDEALEKIEVDFDEFPSGEPVSEEDLEVLGQEATEKEN